MDSSEIPTINATWSIYPMPPDRMSKDVNLIVMFGLYFLVMGAMFLFTTLLTDLSREKELKLRQGLAVVGVSHSVFWFSWLVMACIINAISVLVLVISGKMC